MKMIMNTSHSSSGYSNAIDEKVLSLVIFKNNQGVEYLLQLQQRHQQAGETLGKAEGRDEKDTESEENDRVDSTSGPSSSSSAKDLKAAAVGSFKAAVQLLRDHMSPPQVVLQGPEDGMYHHNQMQDFTIIPTAVAMKDNDGGSGGLLNFDGDDDDNHDPNAYHVFNQAFLLNKKKEATSSTKGGANSCGSGLPLICAAIIFNLALVYHHQATSLWSASSSSMVPADSDKMTSKACKLYKMCLTTILLNQATTPTSIGKAIVIVATNNLAHIYWKICENVTTAVQLMSTCHTMKSIMEETVGSIIQQAEANNNNAQKKKKKRKDVATTTTTTNSTAAGGVGGTIDWPFNATHLNSLLMNYVTIHMAAVATTTTTT